MRARATLTIAALGLAIAALVVTETGQPVAAQSAPIEVGFGEFHFEPAELTVPVGQTIFNLTNLDGQRRHNMVIDVNGTVMESETLGASTAGVWEIMLDQPGTYDFWCSEGNHRERGMVGKITVGDAPAADPMVEEPAG
jgi:plastocyanin